MTYDNDSPRRFDRPAHRAGGYEPGRAQVPLPVAPRGTGDLPRVTGEQERFETRRELLVPRDDRLREHLRDAIRDAHPPVNALLERRRERVLLAVEVTCWLAVVLLLLTIGWLGSYLIAALR